MTLYLKYRPKNLDELDLTDVSDSLKKIMKSGNIPHAFLFAGPKGTGKTSAARILAKIINCEDLKNGIPCEKCQQCVSITKGNNLDVIEMDAASHRGIDDVRTLRDAVKLSPVRAKKKIYIIDEAHMLTTEASNALLKTLEEPPEHVVFILATTNPEKLIGTIKSRSTFIPFRKATDEEISRSLKRVVIGEKVKVKDEALTVIAKAADGAFRDAIKILDQLIAEEKELSEEFLQEFLFKNKSFDTDRFIELLAARDTKNLIIEIGKLGPSGVTTEIFLDSLMAKLRGELLATVGVGETKFKLSQPDLVQLIELFTEASAKITDSPIEELPLEIAIIRWSQTTNGGSSSARLEINSPVAKGATGHDNSRSETFIDRDLAHTEISNAHSQATTISGEGASDLLDKIGEINDEIWKNILSSVKPINASIEALLRSSRPISYDGKVLTLGVFYNFHKEQLEDTAHRRILEDVIAKVLNSPAKVICTIVEPPPKKIVEEAKAEPVLTEGKDADIIKAAKEIFGN